MRWAREGAGADADRVDTEISALLEIGDAGVPQPLGLVRVGDYRVGVQSAVVGASLAEARPANAIQVARRLIELVLRAHRQEWIHGDICPDNIIVNGINNVSLVDWELAGRPGAPGTPGTLGYSPTEVWTGRSELRTWRDSYALAVVIWELLAGRRAFEGSREQIIRAQSSFTFPLEDLPPCDDTLLELFRCARETRVLSRELVQRAQRTDARRAQFAACRAEVRRRVRSLQDIAAKTDSVQLSLMLGAVELQCAAELMALEWQRLSRAPAVLIDHACRLEDIARSRQTSKRLSVVRGVLNVLDELATHGPSEWPALAIITKAGISSVGVTTWSEIRQLWSERRKIASGSVSTSGVSRVLIVECDNAAQIGPGTYDEEFRGLVRCVAGVIEAETTPLYGVPRMTDLIETCRAMEAEGVATARQLLAHDILPATVQTATTRESLSGRNLDDEGHEALLAKASAALIGARTLDAYRHMVRLTSTLPPGPCPREIIEELCDLWSETGRHGITLELLERVEESSRNEAWWLRRLRALTGQRRIDELERELEQWGDRIVHWGCGDEILRLRASCALQKREPARALTILRAADLRAMTVRPEQFALFLVVLGSALRLCGRQHSALRVLRTAERLASVHGFPRLQYLTRANILILNSALGRGESAATQWQELGEQAAKWGLKREAIEAWMRSARQSIVDGREELALVPLARAREALQCVGLTESGLVGEVELLELCVSDRLERWDDDAQAGIGSEPAELTLSRHLSKWEFSRSGSELWLACSRRYDGQEARLARLILRATLKRRSPGRVARLLSLLGRKGEEDAPLCGLVAKTCVLVADDESWIERVLEGLRAVNAPQKASSVIAACHATAIAWGVSRTEGSFRWLYDYLGETEQWRPRGIRRWEWAWSTFTVESRLIGREAPGLLASVRTRFTELCGGIDPRRRRQYRAMVRGAFGTQTWIETVPSSENGSVLQSLTVGPVAPGDNGSEWRRFLADVAGCTMDETLNRCTSDLLRIARAERIVVIFDCGDGRGRARVGGIVGPDHDDIEVCHSVLSQADAAGGPRLFDDAASDPRLSARPSVKKYKPRSVGIVPLSLRGKKCGYVYVENRTRGRALTEEDVARLGAGAGVIASVLEAAAVREERDALKRDYDRVKGELVRAKGLESIGRSSSEVIHELRNLLTVVLGEAQMLTSNRSGQAADKESLAIIQRAAEDGANVIARLQASVRAMPESSAQEVDLFELAREVLLVSRARLARSSDGGATILVEMKGSAGIRVRGVSSELREVVTNLVANAADAMPGGGTLSVDVRRDDGIACVSVRDTGVGMAPEVAQRIFEPFFSTKGEKGNGLGLSIVEGIVRRHGGQIRVTSAVGSGSEFFVELPAVVPPVGSEEWLRSGSWARAAT